MHERFPVLGAPSGKCVRFLLFVAFVFGLQSEARATSQNWAGSPNTWDTGTTAAWSGSTKWTGGYDDATFSTTPGTVTVSDSGAGGNVVFDTMTFGGTGNWLLQGDTIYKHAFSQASGSLNTTAESTTIFTDNSGTGTVTINSPLSISDIGVNHHAYITDDSTAAFSEGSIDFASYSAYTADNTTRSLNFNLNNTTGSISLTGTYTTSGGDASGQGNLYFGDADLNAAANYYLTSTANFTNFDADDYHGNNALQIYSGNLHIATSKFSTAGTQGLAFVGNPNYNQTVDLEGAQTISLNIYDSMKNGGTKASDGVSIYGEAVINQNTAAQSTWSGSLSQDGTNVTLSAVSGGRLIYSGNIYNSTPEGLIITGAGTVVLSNASGNGYNEHDGNGHLQPTTTASATLETGSTTLITNTSGSAFGSTTSGDSTYNNTGTYNFPVMLQSGAILGGTGISTQPIQALAAGSIIAPGDFGQSGLGIAPSLGTLHLAGGLIATSGLTMDFTLNGLTYDSIDFGGTSTVKGGTLNIDNVITFNLTGTPVISPANSNGIYKLLTGLDLSDSVEGPNTQFVFNAPTGYKVSMWDVVAGTTPGKNDYIYVQLALAPEPSTEALLAVGFLGLVVISRFRRLNA